MRPPGAPLCPLDMPPRPYEPLTLPLDDPPALTSSPARFLAVASSSPYQRMRYSHAPMVTPVSFMSCSFSAAVSRMMMSSNWTLLSSVSLISPPFARVRSMAVSSSVRLQLRLAAFFLSFRLKPA